MTKNLELFVHSRRTQAAKQLDDPSLQTFTQSADLLFYPNGPRNLLSLRQAA